MAKRVALIATLVALIATLIAAAMFAACQPAPAPPVAQPAPVSSPVKLGIQADGILTLDGEVVSKDELSRRFEAMAAQTPRPTIYFSPDISAATSDVAHVMALARRLGLTDKMGVIGGT